MQEGIEVVAEGTVKRGIVRQSLKTVSDSTRSATRAWKNIPRTEKIAAGVGTAVVAGKIQESQSASELTSLLQERGMSMQQLNASILSKGLGVEELANLGAVQKLAYLQNLPSIENAPLGTLETATTSDDISPSQEFNQSSQSWILGLVGLATGAVGTLGGGMMQWVGYAISAFCALEAMNISNLTDGFFQATDQNTTNKNNPNLTANVTAPAFNR